MQDLKTVTAAIQYMETHLGQEKISLNTVAAAVHYSKYHLHRIFTDTVGLTIHDYTQRRQLTEAARLLIYSNKPIIEIAFLSGYDSQQAFSHVFKAMYKQSPCKFRKHKVFYPLQLAYIFKGQHDFLKNMKKTPAREICLAKEQDIPLWMDLVRLCIDGFPYLEWKEHKIALMHYITGNSALIMTEGNLCIGGILFNNKTSSIDFLAVHPLYRKQNISRVLFNAALKKLRRNSGISTTTFREGDKADTGYRKELINLGFAEAQLLTEFGYPTQKMILPRSSILHGIQTGSSK